MESLTYSNAESLFLTSFMADMQVIINEMSNACMNAVLIKRTEYLFNKVNFKRIRSDYLRQDCTCFDKDFLIYI